MMELMQAKKSKTIEPHTANHKSLATIYIHDISLVLDKETDL